MTHAKRRDTGWGAIAAGYADGFTGKGDSYHARVILPGVLRLIDPSAYRRVLEVGCGDGFFAAALAEAGAEVAACDIAAPMIEAAKKRSSAVEWAVAPANDLSRWQDESFDAVLIALALQNIEDYQGAIAEAARVLAEAGELILILNHPAFRIPQKSSWGWDEETGTQYRRVDGYLSESRATIDMDPGKGTGAHRTTISFHRPLQVYGKALAKHGFAIAGIEEWISDRESQPGPRAAAENGARKEFPLFLMLRAVKI
ncbi:MAG TPA: class I SAM-dependent methyltransferase [Candidatus Paceibacterota bacterium]|nr:class I SAM-dependent methyltransferase [Candidatus Paceibacterota bacterium]